MRVASAILTGFVCLVTASVHAKTIKPFTFDPPGSVATFPQDFNDAGAITGHYSDGTNTHGFLRNSDGSFVTFDAPGAVDTYPVGINASGEIVGYWDIGFGNETAFIRAPDGKISPLAIPTANYGPDKISTIVTALNDAGSVVGSYSTNETQFHGFARMADGSIVMIDPPGSVSTYPQDIDAEGDVTGFYSDASGHLNGFVRTSDGAFVSFDKLAYAINDRGASAGTFYDHDFGTGFVRTRDGTITIFTVPESGEPFAVLDISESGAVIGTYQHLPKGDWDGFIRKPGGKIELLKIKHAPGVYPQKIRGNMIVGRYQSDTSHGFIWTE